MNTKGADGFAPFLCLGGLVIITMLNEWTTPTTSEKRDDTEVQTLKKILNWINKYTATVAAVVVGIVFLYHQTTRPTLSSNDDILEIGGRVTSYSFKVGRASGRATSRLYYIWLDNYPCSFQIKADFLSFFRQTLFENEIRKGNELYLTIPKELKDKLYERGTNIFILSASHNSTNYLSLKDTIPKENDNFDIYAGLLFISVGVVYYVLKSRAIIK